MIVDPVSEAYWDEATYEAESRRLFEICHGCRLCVTICPAFPALMDLTDGVDGEMDKLGARDWTRVIDLCYQCKLCYVRCPYTPPHEWQVDFPRLMMRGQAIEARRRGVKLQDRILGNTDRLGRLGGLTAPLANLANRIAPTRFVLEKTLGVHRQRLLPRFHSQTFAGWFRRRKQTQAPTAERKVALFYTCYVNYNDPQVGKACVEVLERSGVAVSCPEQQCCGMPFLDGGDVRAAQEKARFNLRSLVKAIEEGCDIVVPGPTCSYTLKQEYPRLLGAEAEPVASRTYDVCEYLMRLHGQGALNIDFGSGPGKIVYHLPCHLKAQNIGYKSRDLMQLIPGASVEVVDRCSGHDGAWSAKKEYFELSLKVGRRLFEDVREAQPAVVATDCPLAGIQIEQATGVRPAHPVQVLQAAYKPEKSE
jgi:anaerobic glycerol-3-phosphate dehydrogenase C subunit